MKLYATLVAVLSSLVTENVMSTQRHLFLQDFQIDPGFSPHHIFSGENGLENNEIKFHQETYDRENVWDVLSSAKKQKETFTCPFPWGNFPVPKECAFYYKCSSSKAKKTKCPSKKYFDKVSKKCVDQAKAECETEDSEHVEKIAFECPFTWGTFPYPDDCSKHYLCLFDKPSLKRCRINKLYNVKKKKCEDKNQVDCGSRFNPYLDTTSTTEKLTTAFGTSVSGEDIKTSNEYASKDLTISTVVSDSTDDTSKLATLTTSNDSSVKTSDDSRQTTIRVSSISDVWTDTTDVPESSTKVSESTTIEVPESTTQFSESPKTEVSESTTKSTTDNITTKVTEKNETSSTNDSTLQPTEETYIFTSSVTSATESSTENYSTSVQKTTLIPTSTEGIPKFICPEAKGKYPDPQNCAQYYVCKNSKATLRKCGTGLKFHRNLKQCYDEKLVSCD